MAYIRCSDAIHKAVKLEAAAREISMQDLTAEAWAAYESTKNATADSGEGETFTKNQKSEPSEITYTQELRTLVSGIKVAAEAAEKILGAPVDGEGESSMHHALERGRRNLERAKGIAATLEGHLGNLPDAGGKSKRKAG